MTFQNPLFITTNTIAGVPATTFTQGQFDLYPSNDYYNVKGEFARKFPKFLKSRVTGVVSLARSQQNDNLIPSAIEPLTGGTINGVPTANVWNTTASLSRLSADARIDTTLADVGILLNPARALAVKGQGPLLRYRQQHRVPGLQSADGAVGTSAEQRLGRVLRDAEPDRRQQSGGYAEHRLQRHRL